MNCNGGGHFVATWWLKLCSNFSWFCLSSWSLQQVPVCLFLSPNLEEPNTGVGGAWRIVAGEGRLSPSYGGCSACFLLHQYTVLCKTLWNITIKKTESQLSRSPLCPGEDTGTPETTRRVRDIGSLKSNCQERWYPFV